MWKMATIEETCDILDKLRKPITKSKRIEGPYPYYGATGVLSHVEGYLFDEPLVLIGEDGAKWDVGDKTAFVIEGKTWVNNHAHVVRPNRNMLIDQWLIYFIEAIDLAPYITGLTVPKLNQAKLKTINFPLPPLEEQKRIVGVLDEAFAGIDQAIANTEKNLQNARDLFESYLNNIFTQKDIDIKDVTVENLAKKEKGAIRTGPFGSQLLHSEFVDEGIAVLGIDNAVANHFKWGKRRFITEEKYQELSKYTVKPGDVLITIMGTCGRCAVVPVGIPRAINTKHLCRITLNEMVCIPEFLHIYFLHHPDAQGYLKKRAKGSIMAGLNMGIIKELPVKLPSLKAQKEMIAKFGKAKIEIGELESTYSKKLAALKELKQSLLQKAFAGELTSDQRKVA